MRFYIAGPMRGRPNLNKASFDFYEAALREMGHEVINPWTDEGDGPFSKDELREFMERDLNAIATAVDAVFLLPEWNTSRGALVERFYAHYLGIPVIEFDGFVIHFNNTFHTWTNEPGHVTGVVPPSDIFLDHEALAARLQRSTFRPAATC